MQNITSTLFFWTAFGIITWFVFRYIYFSKNSALLKRLRFAGWAVSITVLALFLFPWQTGRSGWELIWRGDGIGMAVLGGLMLFTTIALLFDKHILFKAGTVSNAAATIIFFWVMTSKSPQTFQLTASDTAPIFTALLLLINNIILLLLWNQLQKRKIPNGI